MIQPDATFAELNDLLTRLCDDGMEQPNWTRLETLLLDDPAAQDYYRRFVALDVDLAWRAADRSVDEARGQEEAGLELGTRDSEKAADVAVEMPQPLESQISNTPFPTLSPIPSSLSSNFVGGPVFSYMVATVILGVMLISAWAYNITHFQPQFVEAPVKSVPSAVRPELVFVGRISGMKDCRWTDLQTEAYAGASVPLNRKYALASGLMEITYKTGAKVILQGPCTYTVESQAGGFLALGKLTALIESAKPQAANHNPPSPLFSVRTPTAIVIDLGTEFGVEVSDDGNTTSHVFRGSVIVRLIGDGQTNDLVVRKNESARTIKSADGGKSSIIKLNAAEQSRFVREMPSPRLMGGNTYAELVLSLDPVLYYRMERSSGKRNQQLVHDSAPGGNHGRLFLGNEFGGTPYRTGRFGDALSLRGPDVRDRVIVKDYPKARENQLTVVAWVMATGRPGWAMIAANWGHPSVKGQFHLGLYQKDGDLSVSLRQSDGKQVDLREGTEQPFPLFDWQFVALAADGDTVKLYRNGKMVASTACDGIYADTPLSGLGIGCRMNDENTDAPVVPAGYHYWQGRIDEFAIFNQALSDEQIKLLFTRKQTNKEPDSAAAKKGE